MNSLEKITKGQLQSGIVDAIQISGVTLYSTSWNLVGGYYTYVYNNTDIDSSSIVEVIPDKSSMTVVRDAQITPDTLSSTGTATFYAINAPTANITVTVNIYNTDDTPVYSVNDWIRPSDWLLIPTIGTQEFIGLLAITDDEANHIALLCAGNYTVDWGDGTIENFSSGVKANHSYTYSSISNLTISSRGYKQVLVRVTPQAGQNLTTVNLQQQNSILAKPHTPGWLDISVNGSNITTISLGGSTVRLGICERVNIGSIGVITNFNNFFWQCYSLQSVSLFNTASGTNFSQMFKDCYMLKSIPLFVTSAGTNFSSMFSECRLLITIPLLNTAIGTNFSSMFSNCRSLQTIPLINTILGNNFQAMFSGCNNLSSIPLINTQAGLTFDSMFSGCSSLQTIPLLNTAAGTNFYNMFESCSNLTTIPLLNTSAATTVQRMFLYCASIQQVPNLNTALATNFADIFTNCSSVAKGAFQGTRYSISYANMCLSRNAVLDIFNGLGTAVGAQTVTITTNPAFNAKPLNITGNWRGVTIQSSSQDVYVSNTTTGYIHKQTGGVGPFVIDSSTYTFLNGMGTDIYGNIYCARPGTNTYLKKTGGVGSWATISTDVSAMGQMGGDFLGNLYFASNAGLYKQTAMIGSSVQVYSGVVNSFTISPIDGSIYVTDRGATGTIYKQTAGTGSFVAVQNIPYCLIFCSTSGDVYACNGAVLYKQTAGTGLFVSMGITNPGNYGGVEKSDGTLYTISTDIYLTDFNQVVTPTDRLIATNKGFTIA